MPPRSNRPPENNPFASPRSDLNTPDLDPDLYPEGDQGPVAYASFWARFVAVFVDGILIGLLGMVFRFFIFGIIFGIMIASQGQALTEGNLQLLNFLAYIIGIVVGWLYCALQESSAAQATIGKKAMGLRVTDEAGNRISFGRASGRHFGKIISSFLLFIGWLMQPFTKKKQALHDLMAGTLVVKI